MTKKILYALFLTSITSNVLANTLEVIDANNVNQKINEINKDSKRESKELCDENQRIKNSAMTTSAAEVVGTAMGRFSNPVKNFNKKCILDGSLGIGFDLSGVFNPSSWLNRLCQYGQSVVNEHTGKLTQSISQNTPIGSISGGVGSNQGGGDFGWSTDYSVGADGSGTSASSNSSYNFDTQKIETSINNIQQAGNNAQKMLDSIYDNGSSTPSGNDESYYVR